MGQATAAVNDSRSGVRPNFDRSAIVGEVELTGNRKHMHMLPRPWSPANPAKAEANASDVGLGIAVFGLMSALRR